MYELRWPCPVRVHFAGARDPPCRPTAAPISAAANLTASRLKAHITGWQDLPGKAVGTWDDDGEPTEPRTVQHSLAVQ